MFFNVKKKLKWIASPASGKLKQLNRVEDPVFAAGTMGDGFAVVPDSPEVCSPVNGTVATVFPGGHAICINADSGAEVLIHIGIDTVKRKGDGFQVLTQEGAKLKAGDAMVRVDLKKLKADGFNTDIICVAANAKGLIDDELYGKSVAAGAPIMSIK